MLPGRHGVHDAECPACEMPLQGNVGGAPGKRVNLQLGAYAELGVDSIIRSSAASPSCPKKVLPAFPRFSSEGPRGRPKLPIEYQAAQR